MTYKSILFGNTYKFGSVKEVLAKANEEKSGDILAGIAASSDKERIAAKDVLAQMTLKELRENPVVPYEDDEVTRIDQDSLDLKIYNEIKGMTVGDFREWLLKQTTSGDDIKRIMPGLTSEMIAGVTKLMSNLDLIYAASRIEVTAQCNTIIGEKGTLSSRLQPNHPTDDIACITASLFEGLSYGCGDAVLGVNPVNDTVSSLAEVEKVDEIKSSLEIPTQICVLGHITTQIEAVKKGAPTDMIFQSIAGSEKGNRAFGFNADIVKEAQALLKEKGTSKGPNIFYFETGQGSELSSEANYDADQVTMEARCYGFAKAFKPFW